jgi:hypothetical protein
MVNISVRRRSILARFPTSSCGTISSMALLGRMPSCGIQNMCFCCLKINVHSPTWHLYFLDSICICVLYKYIYIYIYILCQLNKPYGCWLHVFSWPYLGWWFPMVTIGCRLVSWVNLGRGSNQLQISSCCMFWYMIRTFPEDGRVSIISFTHQHGFVWKIAGWWFGTFFSNLLGRIIPTDKLHHFSGG